jgi:hypothetical protein
MASSDNRRAEFVLVRAKGDAELALALAKVVNAKAEAQQAMDKANALQQQNQQQLQNASPPQGAP